MTRPMPGTRCAAALALTIALFLAVPARGVPRPEQPGPLPVAEVLIDDGCDYDLDGKSISWSDPVFYGPLVQSIEFGDNDFGFSDTRCPGDPAEKIDMKARVFYPGTATAVAAGGPFPFVAILHGQQFYDIPGFEGYDYLGKLLASHGYVVASLDGRSLLDATIKSRGEHVREHLRRFAARNAPGSGSMFEGKLDLQHTSLIGHSRGGEAVVAAWEWQRVAPDPGYAIVAIVAIAPVQFFGGAFSPEPSFVEHMRDVSFQIIQGADDGDVSDFQGLRLYDRAADIRAVGETLKSLVFVDRANHNFFNSVWEAEEGDDCACPGVVLDGKTARKIAKGYIHAFLDVAVKHDARDLVYLTGRTRIGSTRVVADYQAPGSQFVSIDSFEELPGGAHDGTHNSVGGAVAQHRFGYAEVDLASTLGSYTGDTWAGVLSWPEGLGHVLRSDVPAAVAASLTGFDHLSFRIGEIPDNGSNPARGNVDLAVSLIDAQGRESSVHLGRFAVVPPPFLATPSFVKTVLGVVRIPLAAFRDIDPTAIRAVRFESLQQAGHEVAFDDLRFSR
jgi:hypothetical protein